jgi:hypothetical protein
MGERNCKTPDCEGRAGVPGSGYGWCTKCYQRWRKYGDPLFVKRIFGDIEARFLSYVDRRGDDECWPWTGYVDEIGYGIFGAEGKLRKAHIWAYEHFIGPVPKDRPEVDHVCHSNDKSCPGGVCLHRRCVNYLAPHLEPVTHRENVLRGRSPKMSDELVAVLHARWVSGETVAALAREAKVARITLDRRLQRITLAVPVLPPGRLF